MRIEHARCHLRKRFEGLILQDLQAKIRERQLHAVGSRKMLPGRIAAKVADHVSLEPSILRFEQR
jgi:hypothetical protein